ncbi:hypothetical protein [Paenibacillus sp. O199]|uniref:hypothetical protein n=1 Tax=Paenibacillus sp. O199 TaxID=1643925 RepID=UPI0007BF882D|nr:hypothetical protein [Paenibacillus sp. O199]
MGSIDRVVKGLSDVELEKAFHEVKDYRFENENVLVDGVVRSTIRRIEEVMGKIGDPHIVINSILYEIASRKYES